MTSRGSLGSTPSPCTTVSAKACFDKAAAASPAPITVRRSISPSHIFCPSITLFSFCGQGVLCATMKLAPLLELLFLSFAATADAALADDSPAYGPMLEGYSYPFPVQHY